MDYSQFAGRPFQVVSKLGVRYTGIFDSISQEDQTICLSQVYNHGTEDRPTTKKLPGSTSTLGWVRFHTESVESIALVENYKPPGAPAEEEQVDPILASVSNTAPAGAVSAPSAAASASASHPLPPKPAAAEAALGRVQQSLNDLSLGQAGGQPPRGGRRPSRQANAPEVPDAEFDFSKGTQALEAEREARKGTSPVTRTTELEADEDNEDEADDELEHAPHPIAVVASPHNENGPAAGATGGAPQSKKATYDKSSFWDNLTTESSRVSRAEERGRNLDTFGEAGGQDFGGPGGGGFGGRGRGGGPGPGFGGRGGYGGGFGGRGGFGQGQGRGEQPQGNGGFGGYGQGNGNGYRNGDGYGGQSGGNSFGNGYRQGGGFGGGGFGSQDQGYGSRGRGFPGGQGGGFRGRGAYQGGQQY